MIRIKLREIAEQKGLTQVKLAEISHLAPGTIRAYYHDRVQRVDLEVLTTLCRVLGVGLNDIMEYTPEDNPSPKLIAGAA